MKIIVLTGKNGCGKTAALHFVHEKLIVSGEKPTCFEHLNGATHRDFCDVVMYRKKKIAVYTTGDTKILVENAMKYGEQKGCFVLICACNTGFAGASEKIEQIRSNPENMVIEKTVGSDLISSFEANCFDGYRVLTALESMIV
ncbi:hypothetical protein AGMMS49587_09760 [Spirochaetia bacterium]|nr:hypothetical protein AGMMS49587_09760 [Spirochaetia bacterium]